MLVVENSQLIQKARTRALQREGFDVSCVGNGRECLEAMDSCSCDVILMDTNMLVMDGFE